ncbi:MAG: glycoside hydrolase family 3 C-terminal domain-containing protein, partial [Muribaculaceae bacterium]|nr:glycoside hydrolase family 3 C-terminal domain-containing protein [Muribaculaceae bacterium]
VRAGKVPQSVVDDAVARVLRVKFNLGLFEHPYTDDYPDRFLRPASLGTASRLAAESMVLLKNDSTSLLPLSDKKKIAVIGPVAKDRKAPIGAWSAHGKVGDVVSWYDGIVEEFGSSSEIRYAPGCDFDGTDRSGFAAAADAAAWADVVILCLGEMRHWSGENASRSSIALPVIQEQLAAEIAGTGTPVVLVLTNGRPLELTRLEPMANAILEAWQPGINGGGAMAGILSGRINPSGKLAMTFPYATGQIPIYYNRRKSARPKQGLYKDITSQPLYPFGHGLSYTTFKYGDLTASHTTFSRNDTITMTVPVMNTGSVEGQETVHWFISDPYCRITRPEKELKFFEKKAIRPGETVTYTFVIDPMRDLSFVNSDGQRFLEPGEYHVSVNGQSITLNLTD